MKGQVMKNKSLFLLVPILIFSVLTFSASTGRADVIVAASSAPQQEKAKADFVCDGIDDNVEIQAAIDSLPPEGGIVKLTVGKFNISATIHLRPYLTLEGTNVGGQLGTKGTGIYINDYTNINALEYHKTSGSNADFIRIKHFQVYGNKTKNLSSGHGIYFHSTGDGIQPMDVVIEDVLVMNCRGNGFHIVGNDRLLAWGFYIRSCLSESNGGAGLYGEVEQCYITDGFYAYNQNGIHLNCTSSSTYTKSVLVKGAHCYLNNQHGLKLYACSDTIIVNCICKNNSESAPDTYDNFNVSSCDRIVIVDSESLDNRDIEKTLDGFYLNNTTGVLVGSLSYGSRNGANITGYTTNRLSQLVMSGNNFTGRISNLIGSASTTRVVTTALTIPANNTAPDVSGGNVFITSANTHPTEITDLTNPTAGQMIYIIGGSNTFPSTISDSGYFKLSADWSANLNDVLILFVRADNDYIEIGRVDN
jgi:hypothetical protein